MKTAKLLMLAAMLFVVAGLGGCDWRTWRRLPAPAATATRGQDLRVGFGYSALPDPADAARAAINAATSTFRDIGPDLVLVWDNWNNSQAAERGLAELANWTAPKTIYGGHVAWPVATTQSDSPAVAVVALAGGWRVQPGSGKLIGGREDAAAAELANAVAPLAGVADEPGQLLMLFGELPGPRATALLASLTRRIDKNTCVFGGGGGGQAGSGWQYAAGQIITDSVWAVRLSGPFTVAAMRVAASNSNGPVDHETIASSARMAVTVLMGESGRTPAGGWRLLLMTPSAGWLGLLDSPGLARQSIEQLGPGAIAAGWAGHSQIAPDIEDGRPIVGQFDLAMALISPAEPPAAATQPEQQ